MSPFEIAMLVCFGFSWPFNLWKTFSTKSAKGKSFMFLGLVFIGYISGCIHKIYYNYDKVIFLYALNGLMVFADMALAGIYLRREKLALRAAENDARR